MISIISLDQYDIVEEFKPIDFSTNSLTLGRLFNSVELHIQFVQTFGKFIDCETLNSSNITISSVNPLIQNIPFKIQTINLWPTCDITIDDSMTQNQTPLGSNFTLFFSCPNCSETFQIGLTQYYVNSEGTYSSKYLTQYNSKFKQISVALIPIIIKTNNDIFGFSDSYDSDIKISPLTSITNADDVNITSGVTLYFGDTEIEVREDCKTIWSGLRDVGSLLSLVFFYAIFAQCTHSGQFHQSIKRYFFKIKRRGSVFAYDKKNNEMNESDKKELEKKKQKEFMQFFSFEKYINLQKRVDRIEYEIERKGLLKSIDDQINSNTVGTPKNNKLIFNEHFKADSDSEDEDDEERKIDQFSNQISEEQEKFLNIQTLK